MPVPWKILRKVFHKTEYVKGIACYPLRWNWKKFIRRYSALAPYGHLRRVPTPLPRSFSAVLLSVSDFLAQKYLVDYQLLLQRSQQTFNYLANKENKVRVEEQSKKPHNPPKLCTKARATAPWNKWAKPPANKLIDKMRLAMKLASLFVIYFCSLFACLLAFAVNKTQQEILKCNI